MAKFPELPSQKPRQFTKRFPVSGEPMEKPRTKTMVKDGYGSLKSSRGPEKSIIKQSRRALIQRLGIQPSKQR